MHIFLCIEVVVFEIKLQKNYVSKKTIMNLIILTNHHIYSKGGLLK